MKQIKVLVSFEDNEMIFPNIELVENDYNHVEFIFDFDEDDGKKVFELKKPNGKVFIKEIIDNKVVLSDLDEKGNIIPVINQSGKYEFEITKYKSDSKFTINKTCHFVARDEVVNVDDDIVDKDANLPILNDLITTTIALKENTEKIGQLAKEKGNYAEEQGNYAKKAASNVINVNNQATELINNFKSNINEYTTSFNKNATTKQDEFDSNSKTKINEYNDNVTSKLKQYNDNHESKLKAYNNNDSEKTKAFNSNAEVKTVAYDKNADDKLSAYNTNDATKLEEYNDNATLKIEEYNSNATQKLEEYDEHRKEYALKKDIPKNLSELENDSNYVKNTDYATRTSAGVIKGTGAFCFTVDSEGQPKLNVLDYNTYKQYSFNNFISKGTLENVIEGKKLETKDNKVVSVSKNSTDVQYPSAKCTYKIKEDVDNLKSDILETGEVSDTFIHVEDSTKNELLKLEVDGVCEQETTTGKNLINIEDYSKSGSITILSINNREIKFTISSAFAYEQTIFFKNVALKENKTYTVIRTKSEEIPTTMGALELYDGATWKKVILSGTKNSDTFTVDKDGVYLIRIKLATPNQDSYTGIISNIMVSEVGGDYEPYTGGQPSPSLDYPQDIKTITDSLSVTSCNKNLCNGVSQGLWISSSGHPYGTTSVDNGLCVPVDGVSSYTISSKVTQKRYRIGFTTQNPLVNTSGTCYRYSVVDGTNSTITKSSVGYKYLIVNATDLSSIQIEIGDKETSFEEHIQSQITANLPEGEFIGKIDDTYKDTLSVNLQDDGKYHLILNKMIFREIYDGSEDWAMTYGEHMFNLRTSSKFIPRINSYSNYCIYNPVQSYIYNTLKDNEFALQKFTSNKNSSYTLFLKFMSINNVKEFKNWLSTHKMEIYYVLEEPYKIDLDIVDMPFSFDEVTNIFTDSDLLPKINATYYKNFISTIRNLKVNNETLKNELMSINNRLAVLENANVNAVNGEVIEESEVVNNE